MASAGPPSARREYVVFWLGKAFELKRGDAIARVNRGALRCRRPKAVHYVFQDGWLLSFAPEFVEPWYAAEGPGGEPGSQTRLEHLVFAICADLRASGQKSLISGGMRVASAQSVKRCLEDVLLGAHCAPSGGDAADVPQGAPAFDSVLELVESGSLLRLDAAADSRPSAARPACAEDIVGRALVILGGVMDMTPEQKDAVVEVCGTMQLQHRMLSLSKRSELTSKCIKAIEAAEDLGYLAPALAKCKASGWIPLGEISESDDIDRRAPFHLFYACPDKTLAEFCATPDAANLYVDTFLRSKKALRNTQLTVMGNDGRAFTFREDCGLALKEREGMAWIQMRAKNAEETSFAGVISQWVMRSRPRGLVTTGGGPLVLHVDEACAGRRPLLMASAQGASALLADGPVMVVLAPTWVSEEVQLIALQAGVRPECFARCAVGGLVTGPSLLCMLHTDGLLARAIRRTAAASSAPPAVSTGHRPLKDFAELVRARVRSGLSLAPEAGRPEARPGVTRAPPPPSRRTAWKLPEKESESKEHIPGAESKEKKESESKEDAAETRSDGCLVAADPACALPGPDAGAPPEAGEAQTWAEKLNAIPEHGQGSVSMSTEDAASPCASHVAKAGRMKWADLGSDSDDEAAAAAAVVFMQSRDRKLSTAPPSDGSEDALTTGSSAPTPRSPQRAPARGGRRWADMADSESDDSA